MQSQQVRLLKQCVAQRNWHCDVKTVPTMTQIKQRFLFLHKYLGGKPKLRPCDFQCQVNHNLTGFRICLVVSLRALLKRLHPSETSKHLLLILDFDSVSSSSNAR